jgi:hypothetical protein
MDTLPDYVPEARNVLDVKLDPSPTTLPVALELVRGLLAGQGEYERAASVALSRLIADVNSLEPETLDVQLLLQRCVDLTYALAWVAKQLGLALDLKGVPLDEVLAALELEAERPGGPRTIGDG